MIGRINSRETSLNQLFWVKKFNRIPASNQKMKICYTIAWRRASNNSEKRSALWLLVNSECQGGPGGNNQLALFLACFAIVLSFRRHIIFVVLKQVWLFDPKYSIDYSVITPQFSLEYSISVVPARRRPKLAGTEALSTRNPDAWRKVRSVFTAALEP